MEGLTEQSPTVVHMAAGEVSRVEDPRRRIEIAYSIKDVMDEIVDNALKELDPDTGYYSNN